jgi:hypothetical protein
MLATTHRLLIVVACAAGLPGCANYLEKVTGWMSSDADTFAVVDGQILQGKMNFALARAGSLQMQTRADPALTCVGPLRYTATHVGTIEIDCNDGRNGRLSFTAFNPVSGTARGNLGSAKVLLTYGMPPDKAAGYLGVPLEALATVPPKAAPAATAAAN